MSMMTCPECKKEISSEAESCPGCGYKVSKKKSGFAAGCGAVIGILFILFVAGRIATVSQSRTINSASPNVPVLELQSWNWSVDSGYAKASGAVKNISGESLKNVEVVVTFKTKDGTAITSADALISFNPILPNQVSPFEALTTANPAMKSASIDFKELMGGTLEWRVREKKKK